MACGFVYLAVVLDCKNHEFRFSANCILWARSRAVAAIRRASAPKAAPTDEQSCLFGFVPRGANDLRTRHGTGAARRNSV
jgi:hypothetical protein